jgi:hypothetical protein
MFDPNLILNVRFFRTEGVHAFLYVHDIHELLFFYIHFLL